MIEESFISSRRPSPLGGRKPTKDDLAEFATDNPDAIDDVLPVRSGELSMLIVGINPGLWTAAVNAPFARPGNRFWPSLHQAGLTDHLVDASLGLAVEDEAQLLARGIGITNLVGRATARADELDKKELREGAARLVRRLDDIRPKVVAVAGITSFRIGYSLPKAHLGEQDTRLSSMAGPRVSTFTSYLSPAASMPIYQVPDLARIWRDVWRASRTEAAALMRS
ncbi:mismatch-specific DNA-glycosylase [Brevibacterium sp. UCMA 11754]|uniref:mismatch-specific DNA-glycosylase n=1 Tax=Brevibacterium sp. UCMA 11754 TaxID=2749198 RepID=UPI001F2F30CB|nr:mismatch-specific DNA-glycosylase [Brevibacterium sp. UCMA 11754]